MKKGKEAKKLKYSKSSWYDKKRRLDSWMALYWSHTRQHLTHKICNFCFSGFCFGLNSTCHTFTFNLYHLLPVAFKMLVFWFSSFCKAQTIGIWITVSHLFFHLSLVHVLFVIDAKWNYLLLLWFGWFFVSGEPLVVWVGFVVFASVIRSCIDAFGFTILPFVSLLLNILIIVHGRTNGVPIVMVAVEFELIWLLRTVVSIRNLRSVNLILVHSILGVSGGGCLELDESCGRWYIQTYWKWNLMRKSNLESDNIQEMWYFI